MWFVEILMVLFTFVYGRLIYTKKAKPALSSWLIWAFATGLSLATYVIAEKKDFETNIFNAADFVSILFVVAAIFLWGSREMLQKTFWWQKYYLLGAGIIVLYGIASGDAWTSNWFTQFLIVCGYFPTLHNMFKEKRNTEPLAAWGILFLAALFSLIPAYNTYIEGNILPVAYTIRALIMIGIILLVAGYYEWRTKN